MDLVTEIVLYLSNFVSGLYHGSACSSKLSFKGEGYGLHIGKLFYGVFAFFLYVWVEHPLKRFWRFSKELGFSR